MTLQPNTQITPETVGMLKACPFCGGEGWLNDYEAKYSDLPPQSRAPQCRSCGVSMGYLPTAKKAIAAWNQRPVASISSADLIANTDYARGAVRVPGETDERRIYGRPDSPAASSPSAVGVSITDLDMENKRRRFANEAPIFATPTPAPVDWERVGPKLVEALESIRDVCAGRNDCIVSDKSASDHAQSVAVDALAAATPGGK